MPHTLRRMSDVDASPHHRPLDARSTYGGQAVVEGVMMRGQRAMAVAVRRPDGEIECHRERLEGLFTGPLRRVPLLRGVLLLFETTALGARALTWSSAIASGEAEARHEAGSMRGAEWTMVATTMLVAIAVFFLGPVLATAWLDRFLPPWVSLAAEAALRLLLLLGYLAAMGRSDEVRRVFQYHGAEHMTIAAHEDGRELTVPAIRRYAKEHPRCGTSFLLTVAILSGFIFAFAGTEPLWWRLASRVVLIPMVAAVAYEAIRFAGFHQRWPLVRLLFAGNIALQRLTTRPPDDEHIQVAVRALEEVIEAERQAGTA